MRRELVTNQQCEHVDRRVIDGAYTLVPCIARHNDRSQGAPQQLVPVKDGRAVRFMCLKHAPLYKRETVVYRRSKKTPPPEQSTLL